MSSASPPRDLLEHILASIAGEPDRVEVRERGDGRHRDLDVRLADADRALLQSDDGRLLSAIQTALDACAWKHHQRAHLHLIDGEDTAEAADVAASTDA
jgi:predicted RNA-binding protein YlqC (UPF0109 family)